VAGSVDSEEDGPVAFKLDVARAISMGGTHTPL
jgi:hypothetical protein